MKLVSHYDIQVLLQQLVDDYRNTKHTLGAFGEYTIAVPNKSIQSWLQQKLVEKVGICSGIKFVSLYQLLHNFQQKASRGNQQIVSKEVLSASLYKILSKLMPNNTPADLSDTNKVQDDNDDELRVVRNWLSTQKLDESLASLCHVLADQFELYQIYRSDWLDAWVRGDDLVRTDMENEHDIKVGTETEQWQAALWRQIVNALPDNSILHRKQLTQEFEAILCKDTFEQQLSDYKQVILFGINQIDKSSLQQLKLISQYIPVTYLWQAPSSELFGCHADIEKNKQIVVNKKAYFKGNDLLAAWGNTAREQAVVFEKNIEMPSANLDGSDIVKSDKSDKSFQSSESLQESETSQLTIIKNLIRKNSVQPTNKISDDKLISEMNSALRSDVNTDITIVSHFSKYREVEGLYDYCLEQFQVNKEETKADKTKQKLIPNDFVILCPDINTYAPYIRSVFENQPNNKKIPYQICGMNQHVDDVATLMLQLISLPQTRYPLSDIIDLLNHNHIKQLFDFSNEDVEQFHTWLNKANVYWGLDKKTLRQLNLPEYERYTLQCGIDRLVLGLSLDGKSLQLDGNIPNKNDENNESSENPELLLGIEGITALQSNLLGKLISFVDSLKHWRDICINENGVPKSYTMKHWCECLRSLTEQMIAVPHKELDSLHAWHQLIYSIEIDHQNEKKDGAQKDRELEDEHAETLYSFAYVLSTLSNQIEESSNASGSYRFGRLNIGTFKNNGSGR